MKPMKKVLALFLALTCTIGAAPWALAAGGEGTDVPPSHWAYDVVAKWSDSNVFEGIGGDAFAPEQALTLGEVAAILSRYFGYTERTAAEVTPEWAGEYVEKAIAAGVLEASGQIDAGAVVTREQAVKYFALAFGIAPVEGGTAFADDADIDETYKPYVNAFQRLGYISGKGNNNFDPKAAYTRVEAVKLLDNAAQPGIKGISTIGYMSNDGVKLSAIAVEYNVDLTGADVAPADYAVSLAKVAWNDNCLNYGDGQIGDILKAYVNSEPKVSADGGDGTGRYVILEMYTDYQYSTEQSAATGMSAGVAQTAPITAGSATIAPSKKEIVNYIAVESTDFRGNPVVNNSALFDTYTIEGLDGFKYYTDRTGYPTDGPAFVAENCFNEQTGAYETVHVSYAIWLPEDYTPSGEYAMVIVDHPASSVHPYEMVRTSRGPSVFIQDWAQELVKEEHGLDGLIVVVPVVEARVGDNSATPSAYSGLVQLWDHLIETYPVHEDHIYGVGQSVGGMILVETNTKRDNFFAGIMMYDNQWGSNYYKDEVFARGMMTEGYNENANNTPRHYPSTDENVIWDYYYDENGQKVYEDYDPNNYYWMVSDDNILITNSATGNWISVNTWMEQYYLYKDLTGYEIPRLADMDFTADLDEQNARAAEFLSSENQQGIYWLSFDGGSNMITPIWTRRLNAPYEWLLKQNRQDEIARPKLDLNKPFELAETQDTTRVVPNFVNSDGESYCFVTGKASAGTKFYNTGWYNMGQNATADRVPGWLPEGMAHPVAAAEIQGVTTLKDGGKLAVAIEYNAEMEGAVIHMVGDQVVDSRGNLREDDFVTMDTFDFYDENGVKIDGTITNIYINSSPAVRAGAERGSGSGHYVIVEIETDSAANSVGVIQRATIRTNEVIVNASYKLWK